MLAYLIDGEYMNILNLDQNYTFKKSDESIYSDEIDEIVETVSRLQRKGIINKEEAMILLKMLINKELKNSFSAVYKSLLGEEKTSKHALSIDYSRKIEQHV